MTMRKAGARLCTLLRAHEQSMIGGATVLCLVGALGVVAARARHAERALEPMLGALATAGKGSAGRGIVLVMSPGDCPELLAIIADLNKMRDARTASVTAIILGDDMETSVLRELAEANDIRFAVVPMRLHDIEAFARVVRVDRTPFVVRVDSNGGTRNVIPSTQLKDGLVALLH